MGQAGSEKSGRSTVKAEWAKLQLAIDAWAEKFGVNKLNEWD